MLLYMPQYFAIKKLRIHYVYRAMIRCLFSTSSLHTQGCIQDFFSGGGKKFCAERAKNFTLYFLKYTFHTEILALQYLSLCAL